MPGIQNKQEAQQCVDRIHAFRQQLAELIRHGVLELTPEQSARVESHLSSELSDLASRFDVDTSEAQKRISLGMRIISTLGGMAFCAALVLFFYRYWGYLGTPAQVVVLVLAPLLGLAALHIISRYDKTSYYTAVTALVVMAAFITNVNMLGLIFAMIPSQGCLLAWGAFALFLAYAYRVRLILAAGLGLLIAFAAATITAAQGGFWLYMFERPENFIPAGLVLAAAPLVLKHRRAVEFPVIYHLVGLLFIFLPIEMLIHMGEGLPGPHAGVLSAIFRLAGFLGSMTAIWLGIRGASPSIVNMSSAFFTLYLFDQLFAWWWDWMPKYLFFLAVGGIALALLYIFQRMRFRMRENTL
jgi:uncharacterized membrane protein